MTTTAMTDTARFQIFMSNWLEDVKEAKYLSRLSYEDLEHTFRHRTESRCILAPNNVCHYEVINEGGFEYDISVEARPRSLDLEETARLLTAGNAEGLALDCRIEPGVDEFRAALRGDSPGLALGRRSEIESDRSKSGLRWTTRWLYLEELIRLCAGGNANGLKLDCRAYLNNGWPQMRLRWAMRNGAPTEAYLEHGPEPWFVYDDPKVVDRDLLIAIVADICSGF